VWGIGGAQKGSHKAQRKAAKGHQAKKGHKHEHEDEDEEDEEEEEPG
jgi:hypothetical protein